MTRIELFGGRGRKCGKRYRAEAPAGMAPGTPFGPGIRALLLDLHHSHPVGFERLARDLFGLTISEGAIAKALRRMQAGLDEARAAIRETLRAARILASDETTTRIDGELRWHWVFLSGRAVRHDIAASRGRAVAETILGADRPEVWSSDRDAGPQDLAGVHQVCLAHVLRDVQDAIDGGDTLSLPRC